MTDSADLHTLTGAYALDALSGREAEEFARHLAECPACAREVRELRETATRLAFAAAQVPPPALRERVMRALPGVRQLPPLVAEPAVVRLRGRRWRQRLPYLAAAACLALAAGTGVWAVQEQRNADQERSRGVQAQQRASDLTTLIAAPDASLRTGAMRGGGGATVVASQRLGQAAILYHDLPPLAGSRVYQLWYSENGSMVPAGLVDPGRSDGAQFLAGGPRGADGVGVTVEPAGGSRTPSGPPVMVVPIPS
ncbi:anti-sigma factor [Streptomyces sp. H10-C2]|uniref:anti-sigma factor n=1 Tax=unclassified Streptomyces TaxID=2593676 RepID=UPI0024BA23C5|nr:MULTISPECIES: anti-sigma factor [unclassified Streptomyces]MDJ0343308.1 anti-sigma factor [Streptomyces sp. PH10-H1]MDJ0372907.1 anti-sigma factor [Streptomyces sp. H10-C2]